MQDIGLAGGVENHRLALGEHCGHDDIGGARHGSLVQKHIASLQPASFHHIGMECGIVIYLGTKMFETNEVCVQFPAADFVASRLGNNRIPDTRQERAGKHH